MCYMYYTTKWFPKESDALEFAEKAEGKVYPEDFLGGYKVYYPLPYVDTDMVSSHVRTGGSDNA